MEMEFANVFDVIEMLTEHRKGNAWIYENGKLKDNIITCDVLEKLKEYCDYAIDIESEEFANVKGMSYGFEEFKPYNNYNYNGNSSEVIEYHIYEDAWDFYVAMSFHIGVDVRVGYTPFVLFRFADINEFFEAFSFWFDVEENDFSAVVSGDAFGEGAIVTVNYIDKNGESDYIEFEWYEIEREELVEEIRNRISETNSKL